MTVLSGFEEGSGRYRIEREIGRGGSAFVYLAHDTKLDRKVALKVLRPDLALSVPTERFLREIEIASKLSHPNILTLIDAGRADPRPGEGAPTLFYVMPYVEGESLRGRLKREKQLPIEVALAITRDVANALAYAHGQGVVHRDIKPENILLHGGHAVVMDFGIARALTVAGEDGVTEGGIAIGTPAYMSPEQASPSPGASPGLDGRSDLYSLGCVLYEMLAGRPPFQGANAQEILSRQMLDPVPAVKAARNAVPEHVERILQRLLAKQPADRFASAADLSDALDGAGGRATGGPVYRRLLRVAAVLLLLIASSVTVWRVYGPTLSAADRSIAVLPCTSIGTGPDNAIFTDGMTEDLINALTRISGLRVTPRTSSFHYRDSLDVRLVARRLDVAYVVECSVRRSGNLMRTSATLVNAENQTVLWSDQYERELRDARDLFAIQDEISRSIVSALRGQLSGEPPRRYTSDLRAWDLYQSGRFYWQRRNRDNMEKAISYFSQAIAIDSNYALAWSGLADAYLTAGQLRFLPRRPAYDSARVAAEHAIRLDERLAEAHVSLGRLHQYADWDWTGAEREFRRAIDLDPRSGLAHSSYGYFLGIVMNVVGRGEEAIREARRGVELEPYDPQIINNLAVILGHARQLDSAIAYYRRAMEVAPDFRTETNLAAIHAKNGMCDEAMRFVARWREVRASAGPPVNSAIGNAYAWCGNGQEARKVLNWFLVQPDRVNHWRDIAILYGALGDTVNALAALEASIETRVSWPQGPNLRNAALSLLENHPRFPAALRSAGLVP